jgi:hypothetical protein
MKAIKAAVSFLFFPHPELKGQAGWGFYVLADHAGGSPATRYLVAGLPLFCILQRTEEDHQMGKKYEYTLEDCDCKYCMYFGSKTQTCKNETCCCLEEKRRAQEQLHAGKSETKL